IWRAAANPANQRGNDWASTKETRLTYFFHFFFGHHGLFSLTPVWLLACFGVLIGLTKAAPTPEIVAAPPAGIWQRMGERRLLSLFTLIVSAVVIGFYLAMARWNYGGWTLGPRWLIWLTPLWLLVLLPAADQLSASRLGRGLAAVCLALSALSTFVPSGNPWHHPWIYTVMEQMGGIPY
ncbi:MAG: hypothetical protein ACRD36_08395, partial [Candidatus Acidiferrum sp.]